MLYNIFLMSQPELAGPNILVSVELTDIHDIPRVLRLGQGVLEVVGSEAPHLPITENTQAFLTELMWLPDNPFLTADLELGKHAKAGECFDEALELFKVLGIKENILKHGRSKGTYYALLSNAHSVDEVVETGISRIMHTENIKKKDRERRIAAFEELKEVHSNPKSRDLYKKIAGAVAMTFVIGGIEYVRRHHHHQD